MRIFSIAVRWHFVELLILTALLVAPILEYIEKQTRKRRVREILGSIHSLQEEDGYGSFLSERSP